MSKYGSKQLNAFSCENIKLASCDANVTRIFPEKSKQMCTTIFCFCQVSVLPCHSQEGCLSETRQTAPQTSRVMCPAMHKQIVPAVVTTTTDITGKRLGLCQVLTSMPLHAVGMCHRLATELTSEHWASHRFAAAAAAAAATNQFLARQLLLQHRMGGATELFMLHPLWAHLSTEKSKLSCSTWCLVVRAAAVTTPGPSPLTLLQDNTVHTLHMRSQVVNPIEPSRTEFTLVFQKVWVVDCTVAPHGVGRRKVLVADVTGKPHLFFLTWRQWWPKQRLYKMLHSGGSLLCIGTCRYTRNIFHRGHDCKQIHALLWIKHGNLEMVLINQLHNHDTARTNT